MEPGLSAKDTPDRFYGILCHTHVNQSEPQELPVDTAVDSISVLPILLGGESPQPQREALFIQGDGKDSAMAVCSGRWKLVVRYDAERNEAYELFNLNDDPGEWNDLSQDHPAEVKRLADALAQAEIAGRTRP